jgi:Tol biopolymer transport system component
MGEVYRARDPRLGRDVAVKVLPLEYAQDAVRLKRFAEEARAVGALSHPNILEIHDVGMTEGRPFVVTELLVGETLAERMRRQGALSVREAVETALQAARGLWAAHEKGIVHRDLKPANLFLTRDGRVKILDFGLAKRGGLEDDAGSSVDSTALTRPGMLLGTVAYMSPEQAKGLPLDARSDIFSLGIVVYEMLAGLHPFRRATSSETLAATLSEDPPPLAARNPQVPAGLSRLVQRCLAKAADERFQSAHDLSFALEAVSSPSALVVNPPRPSPARPAWLTDPGARKRLAGIGLVVGLAVASAAGGWILASRAAGPESEWAGAVSRPLTSDPGWESDPALSPDGSLVAFTSVRSGNPDIWVADVRGGDALRLTDHPGADGSPAWYPDGQALAFVSDRGGEAAIWKVARLGGTAFQVVTDARDPAVSPDGLEIAFSRTPAGGHARIAVAPIDRPEAARFLTGGDSGVWGHSQPSWSPDGRELCYVDFRDVWVVPAAGGAAQRITRDHVGSFDPVWSPDARWVYFTSQRGGTRALWRASRDGRRLEKLTPGTGPEGQPSLSRDGRRLAFSTYFDDSDVLVGSRRSGERFRISGPVRDSMPALAPDGSAVVFASDRAGTPDLWVQALAKGRGEGAPRQLTDQPGSEALPAFSPDGRWVAYTNVHDGARDVYVVPIDGGLPRRLTSHPSFDMHPSWSPDRSNLAFVSGRDGGEHVYVLRVADGRALSDPVRVTSGEGVDYFPTWLPDGAHVAFTRTVKDVAEVWVAPVRGGEPRRITGGAQASCAKWDTVAGALLVAGGWGGDRPLVRRIGLSGQAATAEATLDLARAGLGGLFDVSRDGELYAYTEEDRRGDIWLLERP